MRRERITRHLLLPAALLLGTGLSGCGLMHDDLDPCAVMPGTRTSVSFVYDYNTADRDLFAEQVGAVTLYVFDADGKYVTSAERSNSAAGDALKQPDFRIDFDEDVLKPGNSYRFYAVAHQHPGGYDGLVQASLARFRYSFATPSDATVGEFLMLLDRGADGTVGHGGRNFDALWMSRAEQRADLQVMPEPVEGDPQLPDQEASVTVPLLRVTNHLVVRFWLSGYLADINPEWFEARIEMPQGNGRLGITGDPARDEGALRYTPYAMTAESIQSPVAARCVRAEFALSRLMLDQEATLVVENKLTGTSTRITGLNAVLARGNGAYAGKKWSAQEYLDREYEYQLDFSIDDEVPAYVQVEVPVLGWATRVQLADV